MIATTNYQRAACEDCGATWETHYRHDEPLPPGLRRCVDCVSARAKAKPPRPKKARRTKPKLKPLPLIATHGCHKKHRTYAVLARCRWRRHRSVTGEGRYGRYVEHADRYQSGRMAVWPEIYLFKTEAEARESPAEGERKTFVFQFPSDPGEAVYDGLPYTLEGNRQRYER